MFFITKEKAQKQLFAVDQANKVIYQCPANETLAAEGCNPMQMVDWAADAIDYELNYSPVSVYSLQVSLEPKQFTGLIYNLHLPNPLTYFRETALNVIQIDQTVVLDIKQSVVTFIGEPKVRELTFYGAKVDPKVGYKTVKLTRTKDGLTRNFLVRITDPATSYHINPIAKLYGSSSRNFLAPISADSFEGSDLVISITSEGHGNTEVIYESEYKVDIQAKQLSDDPAVTINFYPTASGSGLVLELHPNDQVVLYRVNCTDDLRECEDIQRNENKFTANTNATKLI